MNISVVSVGNKGFGHKSKPICEKPAPNFTLHFTTGGKSGSIGVNIENNEAHFLFASIETFSVDQLKRACAHHHFGGSGNSVTVELNGKKRNIKTKDFNVLLNKIKGS